MNLLEAMDDPELFRPWFNGPSWQAWRVFLKTLFAIEPLSGSEIDVYSRHTQRTVQRQEPYREAWIVAGRRSGKSLTAAVVATFLAAFKDHSAHLAPGETGTVSIISSDRKQSRTILKFIKAFFELPLLSAMVTNQTADTVELVSHGCAIMIEVQSCSFRSTRGYTLVACLADEIAFWRTDESANPDKEIISAVRPSLSTIPDSLLLAISSPYARKGQLWSMYQRHYGKNASPVLVWQGESRQMNPTLPQSVVDDAMVEDEASARAEWLAQFRSDVESFLTYDCIATATKPYVELPRSARESYFAFTDPSGGSGQDSFTLAIAHNSRMSDKVIVDAVREIRPSFNPETATAELAAVIKSYGLDSVRGDKYAGSWPSSRFATHGIRYQPAERVKSDLYLDALPLFTAGRVELPTMPRLSTQLQLLERRTARGGKDSVDHAPNAHDDVANSVCGAILEASRHGCGGHDGSGIF